MTSSSTVRCSNDLAARLIEQNLSLRRLSMRPTRSVALASESADDAAALPELHSHERVCDGLLNLLLTDRVQERSILGEALREDLVHRHAAVDDVSVPGVFVAEIEIDEPSATRRAAATRVASWFVVAHPPVEDGHLVARADGARALDASLAIREDRRIGTAAMVAEPTAGHARVRNDDELPLRQEGELCLGSRNGLRIARVDAPLPGGIRDDHVARLERTAREDASSGDGTVPELDRRQAEHRLGATT